jgi:hypothetical protein
MADDFKSVLTVLEEFGAEIVADIGANIKAKRYGPKGDSDKIASGNLSDSINFGIEYNLADGNFRFELRAADYWEAVDKGRKAGKRPDPADIVRWLKTPNVQSKFKMEEADLSLRNLPDTKLLGLAYVIARAIGKRGTKPTNIISGVVTAERLAQLESDIADAATVDIINMIN